VHELEASLAVCAVFVHHVRAGDVGWHQIRRELMRLKSSDSDFASVRIITSSPARHAFQDAVPAREQADEKLFDDFFLSDDGAGHLLADAVARGAQAVETFKVAVVVVVVCQVALFEEEWRDAHATDVQRW
jgi:hypothetical protein